MAKLNPKPSKYCSSYFQSNVICKFLIHENQDADAKINQRRGTDDKKDGIQSDFAVLFAKAGVADNFYDCVRRELQCPLIGGTSFRGVLASDVGASGSLHEAGLLLVRDEDGEYGVGVAELGDDPSEAARRALYNALEHAG